MMQSDKNLLLKDVISILIVKQNSFQFFKFFFKSRFLPSYAVTGVVNFILKKNIEGFNASATQGFAQENGYKNDKYQASYGFNFDNDRGNIAFAAEYSSQEALEALDNPWTATSYRNMSFESIMGYERSEDQLNSTAFPDNFYTANAGYYTLNNSGVFGGNSQTFNADGSIREIYTGDQVDGAFCANCDSFNLEAFTVVD